MNATRTIILLFESSCEYGREFLKGVAQFARERRNWHLRLYPLSVADAKNPFDGCDGIIARHAEAATLQRVKASGLPVVDAFCQIPDAGLVGVDSDHDAIATMAAEHFLNHRFKNFAYCGYRGTRYSDMLAAAFARNLAKAGYECQEYNTVEMPTEAVFLDARERKPRSPGRLAAWLSKLPPHTAIFCANDLRAYHVLNICKEIGRKVPSDIAVLGVDNDTVLCSCASVPLSSIDPNAFGVGYAAAQALDDLIEKRTKRHKAPPVQYVNPGDLIARESPEAYPLDPPWLEKVLIHVDANMNRPLSARDLIKLAGVSHTAIQKMFTRKIGMTPGQYILTVKMREAQRLLKTRKKMRMSEIAERTGFTEQKYFCRTYHAYFGHAPSRMPSRTAK